MGKPDAPTPPNPQQTAMAQTSTNVATSVANAYLNHVNQVTPYGNLDFNKTNDYSWTDPSTGQTYSIPQFTETQTLSPTQQAIQGQTEAAQYNLAGMANAQSGRISSFLSQPFDTSGGPAAGNPNITPNLWITPTIGDAGQVQTSFGDAGNIATTYGSGGDITKSVGPNDFSADRQSVQDALMARMNPQLAIQKQQLQQQLADQGIRYGSDAYNNAMLTQSQQENDARFAAINQAGQEQQRMQQEALAQGQFKNAAQLQAEQEAGARGAFQNQAEQQQYEQLLGRGTFANQAQLQNFQQQSARGTFWNAAVAQQQQQNQAQFNASQAARNQYLQEQYAARNQPINEITSLLSGGQVTQPNFLNAPQSQIPTTDIAGLINQNFNQQNAIYGQQMQSWNSVLGGILGLGAGALKGGYVSDERAKENIVHMGTVFAANDDGAKKPLPIYRYSYKADPESTMFTGPMAQDVEKIDKRAVSERGGVKYIKPARVMGSILRAA